jgi:AcrR family transcriptional regulator
VSDKGTGLIEGQRLPRGRHGIPPEVILAHQRERLLSSTTAVLADQGLAGLTVGKMIDRAGVSRTTFYRLFEDKRDCVLAAQERAIKRFQETIGAAFVREADWPSGVAAGVSAALDFAVLNPGAARLALPSSFALAEPALASNGLMVQTRLFEHLRDGAMRCPDARIPDGLAQRAAIGAAYSIIGAALVEGKADSLIELRADLVRIILSPYLGDSEAKRIAMAT